MSRIAVIGTGYVGLVSGACLADFGNSVTCVDNDATQDQDSRWKPVVSRSTSRGLEDLVSRNVNVRDGRLSFTTDLDLAQVASAPDAVVFIAVGTPSRRGDGQRRSVKYVHAAARDSRSRRWTGFTG